MIRLVSLIIIIIGLVITSTVYASEQKLMVNAKLIFIHNDQDKRIEALADFKLYDGNMTEIHSNYRRPFPGGYWNLEVRLNKGNVNALVWKSLGVDNGAHWEETGRDVFFDQDLDISQLTPGSMTLIENANDEGKLILNILPSILPEPLAAIGFKMETFGLDYFCFKESAVVVDDYYFIYKINGFGQRLYVGVSGLVDINISLKQLEGFEEVGKYNDGVISIELEEGHNINILGVGIGPSGYKKGGPFKIYGQILPNQYSIEESLKYHLMMADRLYSKQKAGIMKEIFKKSPYLGGRLTTAGGEGTDEYINRAIGSFFEGRKCG